MSLAELAIENVRSVARAELRLHPQRNLIWGANGSGKTSILEAIFLLGRGRSFRTRNSERLIRHGESGLLVFGRTAAYPEQALGLQVSRSGGTIAKVGGAFVRSLAELSTAFPVQVIEPGIHKLVEEGGHRRRRWMDWLVFHVEPQFIDHWTRYTRALKQRNAALRREPEQANAWNPELAHLGELLSDSRRSLLQRLEPYWRSSVQTLTGLDVELTYHQGWSTDMSLADALDAASTRDRVRGMTHPGPHRGDVAIRLDGTPAREVLSRGQQKLVASAMALSQLELLQDISTTVPTLLLDDPAAELDCARLTLLLEQVARLRCQIIFTALQPEGGAFGRPEGMFHVEQGNVQAVV